MMTIMNMFNRLMKLYLFYNHGYLQPHVTYTHKSVHLHQLKHLLVFKTNHHIPTFNNMLLHQCQPLCRLLQVHQLMYQEAILINHRMEYNLEIHLEEVDSKEICLESHLLIDLLDLLDG
jgi:hypothetical protein